MSSGDAYERSGVSQRAADAAVAALLESLRRIDPGRPSRQALSHCRYFGLSCTRRRAEVRACPIYRAAVRRNAPSGARGRDISAPDGSTGLARQDER